jgi:hypothetical protein
VNGHVKLLATGGSQGIEEAIVSGLIGGRRVDLEKIDARFRPPMSSNTVATEKPVKPTRGIFVTDSAASEDFEKSSNNIVGSAMSFAEVTFDCQILKKTNIKALETGRKIMKL